MAPSFAAGGVVVSSRAETSAATRDSRTTGRDCGDPTSESAERWRRAVPVVQPQESLKLAIGDFR